MDLIERQEAIEAIVKWAEDHHENPDGDDCIMIILDVPPAQPEIVRCKECKYRGGLSGFYCDIVEKAVGVDNFCSWAERRTNEQN